jgi:DNA polymerase-3 subunit gamma/tau
LAKIINESSVEPGADVGLNIFELDAASNNSVEEIRSITDSVRIAPAVGQYKVYIIDEVHMLSQAAFNAFLKTLEEPPRHAIFILATTEKHKVLPTILSRCQIFDFKRIGVEDIASHLAFVASKEGISAEPEALHAIAIKADGALRDSLSIFDRVASFAQGNITYASVVDNLQMLDHDVYFSVVDSLIAHDVPGVLVRFHQVLERGFDGHQFVIGLASHLRDVMLAVHPQTVALMEWPASIKEKFKVQSGAASLAFFARALRRITEAESKYKTSSNPRLLTEVALLDMAESPEYDGGDAEKKNR